MQLVPPTTGADQIEDDLMGVKSARELLRPSKRRSVLGGQTATAWTVGRRSTALLIPRLGLHRQAVVVS